MTDKELRNFIIENNLVDEDQEVLLASGYADAFLGITDSEPRRAVYCKESMVEVVMTEDKCSYTEALEWLEFNTWNSYVGKHTPIYINTFK